MVKSRRGKWNPPVFHPMSFGGWRDYQEWADHDFMPRPADEDLDDDLDDEEDSFPEDEIIERSPRIERGDDLDRTVAAEPAEPVPSRPRAPQPSALSSPPPTGRDVINGERVPTARPYVRTGGRTRAQFDLRLETMLSVTTLGASGRGRTFASHDHQLICDLCRAPRSVAEIAAHLHAPLGTARVLISDALNWQLLVVHEPAPTADGRPSIELMRRVFDGLCRLD